MKDSHAIMHGIGVALEETGAFLLLVFFKDLLYIFPRQLATNHLGRLDVARRVPLLGAMVGGRVTTNFWRGAIVGCHCRCHCWVALLGAMAGCHRRSATSYFVPCAVPLLGDMVGCHGWVLLLDAMVGCHCDCWVPRVAWWGAIAGCYGPVTLLGAIAGRHGKKQWLGAMVGCRWLPLLGAIVGCHCWVP